VLMPGETAPTAPESPVPAAEATAPESIQAASSSAAPAAASSPIKPAATGNRSTAGVTIETLALNDKILDSLHAADIDTIDQLQAIEDLTSIEGIGKATAEKITQAIKKYIDGTSTTASDG
jgi:hypothetical protein